MKKIVKKPELEQKHTLQDVFNSFSTKVWLTFHDKGFLKSPKTTQKNLEKNYGFKLKPTLYTPIIIGWSEKGRGFGEYTFWQEKGKIYCDSECDSRDSVKRILCQMVDQAILVDEELKKK